MSLKFFPTTLADMTHKVWVWVTVFLYKITCVYLVEAYNYYNSVWGFQKYQGYVLLISLISAYVIYVYPPFRRLLLDIQY